MRQFEDIMQWIALFIILAIVVCSILFCLLETPLLMILVYLHGLVMILSVFNNDFANDLGVNLYSWKYIIFSIILNLLGLAWIGYKYTGKIIFL